MTQMIERVAAAIFPALMRGEDETIKADCRERARAAIKAMRIPTEDMENAGFNPMWFRAGTQPGSLDWRPDCIYISMIDEALK